MGLLSPKARGGAPWRPGAAASRRASIAVGVVLIAFSGVAIVGSRAISAETKTAREAAKAAVLYQEAKFYGASEDGELNQYLVTGDPAAQDAYHAAAAHLITSLKAIESVQDIGAIGDILDEQRIYEAQAEHLFDLADAGKSSQVVGHPALPGRADPGAHDRRDRHPRGPAPRQRDRPAGRRTGPLRRARRRYAGRSRSRPAPAPRSVQRDPGLPPQRRGPGAARRADRPAEPAPVRRPGRPGRARGEPEQLRARRDHARPRPVQRGQRHPRPPPRRPAAHRGRRPDRSGAAPGRHRRPAGRRRVRGAAHRRRREDRAPSCRAHRRGSRTGVSPGRRHRQRRGQHRRRLHAEPAGAERRPGGPREPSCCGTPTSRCTKRS